MKVCLSRVKRGKSNKAKCKGVTNNNEKVNTNSQSNQYESSKPRREYICFYCNNKGHTKRYCRLIISGQPFPNEPKNTTVKNNIVEAEVVKALTISEDRDSESWILDSSCTFHMSPRRD